MSGSTRTVRRFAAVVAGFWLTAIEVTVAVAASPTPTGVGVGDPRSSGQGPGLVGDPATAILLVLAIAAASVVVTGAWVRFTRPDRGGPRS